MLVEQAEASTYNKSADKSRSMSDNRMGDHNLLLHSL